MLVQAPLPRPLASHLVLHFEDAMGEGRVQVCIRHLSDAERVDHLVVGGRLQTLELIDSDLAMVDRDKVHEVLVLLNVDV